MTLLKKSVLIMAIFVASTQLALAVCDPNKSASIFKQVTKNLPDMVLQVNKETMLTIKSTIRPSLINTPSYLAISQNPRTTVPNKKIIIKSSQLASVIGYHTDECTAQQMDNFFNEINVSLKVTRSGNQILVETVGASRYIHHFKGFEEVTIHLPRNIEYRYIPINK